APLACFNTEATPHKYRTFLPSSVEKNLSCPFCSFLILSSNVPLSFIVSIVLKPCSRSSSLRVSANLFGQGPFHTPSKLGLPLPVINLRCASSAHCLLQ